MAVRNRSGMKLARKRQRRAETEGSRAAQSGICAGRNLVGTHCIRSAAEFLPALV